MEGFGQTETTLTVATYPWLEPKPGSVMGKGPEYDIDLLTSDGRWAEDGSKEKLLSGLIMASALWAVQGSTIATHR